MNGSTAGNDARNLVLERTSIVELIGQSVALKRRGKDWVGLCPFHQEKTPSFHVSESKQFFHCYGCKAGGTAIDFVMKRDRVAFLDALRLLADRAGIQLPRFGGKVEGAGERQALFDANSAAAVFFEKLLADPQQGRAAREYLEKRRIDGDSVRRFHIGLAPDGWDGLLKSPVARKFSPATLVLAGLVKERPADGGRAGGFYDTFRSRLMFPIRDEQGRIIAFGGRVLPGSEDPAKYLNSPETPLFSKSRCIFGLDLARQRIVESQTVAVVEGYTDVVMAHQYGASNVVSVLGTALTEQHVAILRRFTNRIVLLFDADAAGDAAVDRAVGLFLTQPVEVAIASLPDGVDPDEYLIEHGKEGFERILREAPDALSFKWKQLSRRFNDADEVTAQQKASGEYLEVIARGMSTGTIDALRWGPILKRLERLTGLSVRELERRLRKGRVVPGPGAGAPSRPKEDSARAPSGQEQAERWLLGSLLAEPVRWQGVQHVIDPQGFTSAGRRRLAEVYWRHQQDEGEPVFSELLGQLEDPELKELAIELVEEVERLPSIGAACEESLRYLEEIRRRGEEQKLLAQLRRKDGQLPEQDEVSLLKSLQEQRRRPDLRRIVP